MAADERLTPGAPKSMVSRYGGFLALGKSSTVRITPTRISTFSKSSQVTSGTAHPAIHDVEKLKSKKLKRQPWLSVSCTLQLFNFPTLPGEGVMLRGPERVYLMRRVAPTPAATIHWTAAADHAKFPLTITDPLGRTVAMLFQPGPS